MMKKIFNKIWILSIITLLFTPTSYGNNDYYSFELEYATQKDVIDTPIQEYLDKIATKFNVNIIYDSKDLKNIKLQEEPQGKNVNEVLQSICRKYGLSLKTLSTGSYVISRDKNIPKTSSNINSPDQKQQKITVKGTVIELGTGDPLIGVNIAEKNTTNGTITDYEGKFEISIEEGAILVFSYIGYAAKEIRVGAERELIIELVEQSETIDEVVIVGYGTQRRSDLTGATSSIGTEEIKQLPVTGLDQVIQGRAAGVQVTQNSGAPGGGVSIRIRGIGSTLTAEPLYVIDDIPVVNDNQGSSANFAELDGGGQNSNALNTINPSDIESIEILKDASATAIYGARAANGVVLIKTKRGKKGRAAVSFDNYVGIQRLANKIPVMDLRQYAAYYKDIGWEGIEEFERPELLGAGTDWQDAVFRDAYMQNNQLTISGGSEDTQFAFSGGYHFKEGIVVGSDFTRYSGKINIDHQASKKIRFGNSLLVSRTKENITFNDNSNGVIYTALLMVPNAPVRNADGSFAGPQEEITLAFDNPVARALETNDVNTKTRILANFYGEAEILPWLKYRTEFGTDIIYANHNTFFPSFQRGNFFGKSGVRRNNNNSNFWINKHLLTFNTKWNDRHSINTLLGFEAQKGTYEWLFASRDNLPTNELQQLNLGDAGQQQNGGGAGHWSLLSYFGRINYGLDDKYLLTATLRADGSSRFGPNNRFGYFPSAAFAWRISEENFLKSIPAIDNLKLRVGVGSVGNQEIGLYSYLSNLAALNVVFGDQLYSGFAPSNIANPDVRWESSFQYNIGVDLGLFKNKLEFTADYYVKLADGMLLPALIPTTAGSLSPPFVNIGAIENKGIELTLNHTIARSDLIIKNGVNFTVNRNLVQDLGSNGNLIGIVQRIPVTRTVEGRPISQFYGYVTDGIFRSNAEVAESPFQQDGTRPGDIKFKDLNNDGIINDADQTYLGSPLPDFTANYNTSLQYKNFDLSVFIQGVFGNEVLNLIRRDTEGMAGLSNQLARVSDRYTPTNQEGSLPRATTTDPNGNRRISDRFIEDGTFIRIKNLSIGYNFSRDFLERMHLKNLRLYASAQNLATWTDYQGYDPEIGSYNQNPLINGVENGRYPIAISLTFGVNATF